MADTLAKTDQGIRNIELIIKLGREVAKERERNAGSHRQSGKDGQHGNKESSRPSKDARRDRS
jgi:hypothetical protein